MKIYRNYFLKYSYITIVKKMSLTQTPEITSVEKICKWNLSPNCVRWGGEELFKGRCCYYCEKIKSQRYYIDNKEVVKMRNRERSQALAALRKQAKLEELARVKAEHPKIKLTLKKFD